MASTTLGIEPKTARPFSMSLSRVASGGRGRSVSRRSTRTRPRRSSASLGAARKNLVVATGTGLGQDGVLPPADGRGAPRGGAHPSPAQFAEARRAGADPLPDERAGERPALAPAPPPRRRGLRRASSVRRRAPRRHPTFGMYTGRTPYAGPRDGHQGRRAGRAAAQLVSLPLELDDPELAAHLRVPRALPLEGPRGVPRPRQVSSRGIQERQEEGEGFTKHNWEQRLLTGPGGPRAAHAPRDGPRRGDGRGPRTRPPRHQLLDARVHADAPLRAAPLRGDAALAGGAGEQVPAGARRGAHVPRREGRGGRLPDPPPLRAPGGHRPPRQGLGDLPRAPRSATATTRRTRGASPPTSRASRPRASRWSPGARTAPKAPRPGDAATADVLAAIDLDALHAAPAETRSRVALAPLFAHLGREMPGGGRARAARGAPRPAEAAALPPRAAPRDLGRRRVALGRARGQGVPRTPRPRARPPRYCSRSAPSRASDPTSRASSRRAST